MPLNETFSLGKVTKNGRRLVVNTVQVETTRDNEKVTAIDNIEPEDMIPGQLNYQIQMKLIYSNGEFIRAMQSGETFPLNLYVKDRQTNLFKHIRTLKGVTINKNTFGEVDGKKGIMEDITAEAAKMDVLD
jgi:hypothetical protein